MERGSISYSNRKTVGIFVEKIVVWKGSIEKWKSPIHPCIVECEQMDILILCRLFIYLIDSFVCLLWRKKGKRESEVPDRDDRRELNDSRRDSRCSGVNNHFGEDLMIMMILLAIMMQQSPIGTWCSNSIIYKTLIYVGRPTDLVIGRRIA